MPIVGFNFDKIFVEKQKIPEGNIQINNSMNVKDVLLEKIPVKGTEQVLRFNFEYSLNYEPQIGNLLINGHVLFLDEDKKIKDILKDWKKDKKVSTELMHQILNAVLFRCSIKALGLAQEVNLPPHIPMPSVQPTKNVNDYIG